MAQGRAAAAAGLAAGLGGYAAISRVRTDDQSPSPPAPPRSPGLRAHNSLAILPVLPHRSRWGLRVPGTGGRGGPRADQCAGGARAEQELWGGWGAAAREMGAPDGRGVQEPEMLLGPEFRGVVARGWNLGVDAVASTAITWVHERGW